MPSVPGVTTASIERCNFVPLPSFSRVYVLVTGEAGGAARVLTPNILFGSSATISFSVENSRFPYLDLIVNFVPTPTLPLKTTSVMVGLKAFWFPRSVRNAKTFSTGLLMLMLVSIFAIIHLLFDGRDCSRFHKKANRKKVVAVNTIAEPETILR